MIETELKLGEILVRHFDLATETIEKAVTEKSRDEKLGAYLVSEGIISSTVLAKGLAIQYGLEFVDIDFHQDYTEAVSHAPFNFVKSLGVFPLGYKDGVVTLAISSPDNIQVMDEIDRFYDYKVNVVVSDHHGIHELIGAYYDELSDLSRDLAKKVGSAEEFSSERALSETEQFIDAMFLDAFKKSVSDIHIQPLESGYDIRYRIDGKLVKQPFPKNLPAKNIINSIKVLSSLKVEDNRSFQEGRFFRSLSDKVDVDARISVSPSFFGESVTIRLAYGAGKFVSVNDLGLTEQQKEGLLRAISHSSGMVVFAAPTGEGKSTSLSALLSHLNKPEKKLISIEDPVERKMPGVEQIEVSSSVSFASAFKASLRRDPDIVMLGEVRDTESVKICLQASLSGHMVITSIHAKDSLNGLLRFVDMSEDMLLTSMSLRAVVSQRLLVKNCPHCVEESVISDPELLALIGQSEPIKARRGQGCARCAFTGLKGRIGVFEILLLKKPMATALQVGDIASFIAQAEMENSKFSMKDAALHHLANGFISAETLRDFLIDFKDE